MSTTLIQINQIQIYRLSLFPEQRINQLVSELNVHYSKINNYITINVSKEKIAIEIIDSFSKLEEIARLAPHRLHGNNQNGDFRLGVDLLESIIALLDTQSGHPDTRKKLLDLGWNMLQKLYSFNYHKVIEQALLFNWLKTQELVQHNVSQWSRYCYSKKEKVIFSPSEEDLNEFYSKNRKQIYEYMIYDMGNDKTPPVDPFSDPEVSDFYHYYEKLSIIPMETSV